MVKYLLLCFIPILCTYLFADNQVLENYVKQGLKHNLALQQEEFSLNQSLEALKQSRGMFLPAVSVQSRYSRAGGGRTFQIPIGDLFNPIHKTLNQFLQAQGVPPKFPENLENQEIPFLREEEQETKLRFIQPLFQPKILYNYNIKKNLARAREAERNAFKRQLVAEIKTAYFGYLKAVQIEHLLNETAILLRENLRVSKSLYRNHKATEEVVFRAQAELSELKQQKAEAGKGRELTAAYFNFLLNRPLDESIIEVADSTLGSLKDIDLAEAENRALAHREEFEQLQRSINAASNNVSVAKTEYLPGISFVFDYGIQGESYRFSKEADFWMASVVLQWNLFNGFQDKAKVQQARLEEQKLKTKQRELQKQILLKVREAHHNLKVARRTVIATNERLNSAKKSFQIVNKKYSQGMAPQIEYLDARTSFTNAGVNQIIARYDLQIRLAEFERVIADYPLQKNGKDN